MGGAAGPALVFDLSPSAPSLPRGPARAYSCTPEEVSGRKETEMTTKSDDTKWQGRVMPGPVALASLLLSALESIYAHLVTLTPDGPDKDLLVLEWTNFRDEYKPMLDRVIQRGR